MKRIVGIDLFCGIGGLTHGLFKAGIKIVAGFDNDLSCKTSFSQKLNGNPKFVHADLRKISKCDVVKYFPKNCYKLVAGCAPCQPYSLYQKNKSSNDILKHSSYGLIQEYLKIVNWVQPHFVVMENVPNLKNDQYFKNEFLFFFRKNYLVDYQIVNMINYGAPQNRRRLLFLGVKKTISKSLKNIFIPNGHIKQGKSVFKSIGSLPKIRAGERDKIDRWHVCSKLSSLNLKRIRNSIVGGTWNDWPENLLPNCYKKISGKTFSAVYGRIDPNKPSPTLTTQFNRYGSGRFGHYEQDRGLSIREGAILQTFPKKYQFDIKLGITAVARQIGNAVPPIFAEKLGKKLIQLIK